MYEIDDSHILDMTSDVSTVSINECKDLLAKQSVYFCKQLEVVRHDIMKAMENEFSELLEQISTTNNRLDIVWNQTELAFNRAEENTRLINVLKMKINCMEELLNKSEQKCEELDYELHLHYDKNMNTSLASWC